MADALEMWIIKLVQAGKSFNTFENNFLATILIINIVMPMPPLGRKNFFCFKRCSFNDVNKKKIKKKKERKIIRGFWYLELPAINNAKTKTKGIFCEIQLFLKVHHKINLNCD